MNMLVCHRDFKDDLQHPFNLIVNDVEIVPRIGEEVSIGESPIGIVTSVLYDLTKDAVVVTYGKKLSERVAEEKANGLMDQIHVENYKNIGNILKYVRNSHDAVDKEA